MSRLDKDKSLYELRLDIENLSALSPENELQANYELILDKKYDTINQYIENVLSTASNQLNYSAIFSGIWITLLIAIIAFFQYRIQQARKSIENEIKGDVTREVIDDVDNIKQQIIKNITDELLKDKEVENNVIEDIIKTTSFENAVKNVVKLHLEEQQILQNMDGE
jgi:hypothetical protein